MPVTLSVKDVPDDLADALRARAARNHRSLQGELMAILEATVHARPFRAVDLLARVRALGVQTPAESTDDVRALRDRR